MILSRFREIDFDLSTSLDFGDYSFVSEDMVKLNICEIDFQNTIKKSQSYYFNSTLMDVGVSFEKLYGFDY